MRKHPGGYWCSSFVSGNASPNQHTHRFTERKTIGGGAALDGLNVNRRSNFGRRSPGSGGALPHPECWTTSRR